MAVVLAPESNSAGQVESKQHELSLFCCDSLNAGDHHVASYVDLNGIHASNGIKQPSRYIAREVQRKYENVSGLLHVDCDERDQIGFVTDSKELSANINQFVREQLAQLQTPSRSERLYITGASGVNKKNLICILERHIGKVAFIRMISPFGCADYGHSAVVELHATCETTPKSLPYMLRGKTRTLKIELAKPRLVKKTQDAKYKGATVPVPETAAVTEHEPEWQTQRTKRDKRRRPEQEGNKSNPHGAASRDVPRDKLTECKHQNNSYRLSSLCVFSKVTTQAKTYK